VDGIVGANIIAKAVAEYGILGLGWILFIFAMMYIRAERARYQDLVIHIITYFTKIHMLKGSTNDVLPEFSAELLAGKKPSSRSRKEFGRDSDSQDNER
jgi:hypothetical protein